MLKHHIINALIRKNGYRAYLEIATPYAGGRFKDIERTGLRTCHRLVYRCPDDFDDGFEVTFRSGNDEIETLLPADQRYDMVFIDAWHTLGCVSRDLREAFSRLTPGGTIVLHDCCPTTKKMARPEGDLGPWNGMAYCAFLDFVLSTPETVYYTVNTDFGCGVIKRKPAADPLAAKFKRAGELADRWRSQRSEGTDVFAFFRRHRKPLLRLVSGNEFLSMEDIEHRGPVSRLYHTLTEWPHRWAFG